MERTGVVTIPAISGTSPAFSVTLYENSPLNRIVEQGAPGAAWQPNVSNADLSHTTRTSYGTNDGADITTLATTNKVMLYAVAIAADGTRTLLNAGVSSYGPTTLQVSSTKDENWQISDGRAGISQQFKDKDERIVLKRLFNKKPDGSLEMLSTYYVYDDRGNLCFVLPAGRTARCGHDKRWEYGSLMLPVPI